VIVTPNLPMLRVRERMMSGRVRGSVIASHRQ
jgi:hypothetical protein